MNNHVTLGAMPSLADSEGILGTEGFTSSANLSALTSRKIEIKMSKGIRVSDFCFTL